ncbi:hypothetical protein TRFO_13753 [Tritrichomonas foetus]|uniref:L-type lectin-like domain-containing protein n=1 Tax=Tritrichomonas foetus TaxID=1144522 RepID=A0A1J4KX65_9EUKA|nr:hypothetical protein TRFO_13753 [Tritrichomonas foetus]|eukprot:OHT15770.1 hypothetical protein TRFO_13753 [Tritrichomonas foetus]
MIFKLLLLPHFVSSTDNIAERKFVSSTKKFKNSWEYGGYTTYNHTTNHFQIVTGEKYSEGFLWFSNRLPREKWNIRAVFEYELDSQFNQFAIWITSKYGPSGDIFGGPSSFSGIAVLCRIKSKNLEIEVREGFENETFNQITFNPEFTFNVNSPKLYFNLSLTERNHLQIFFKCNEKETLIFNNKPVTLLSHFWLGVTSLNSQDGKPLYVNSIKIHGLKPKFIPQSESTKKFNETNSIFTYIKALEYDKNDPKYFDAIKLIEILVNSSNKMLRSKYLTKFTCQQLLPYADSWQRRSLSATNNAKFLRGIIREELDLVEAQVENLGYLIHRTFRKFQAELSYIEQDIMYELFNEYIYDKSIRKAHKQIHNRIPKFLLLFSICEVIFLLVIGPYMLIIKGKRRKFETE